MWGKYRKLTQLWGIRVATQDNAMPKLSWSWNSNTLATWCKELTHWKRPWCWKRLKAGGDLDDRGWDESITDSLDMSFSKLRELGMDREVWCAAVHGIAKSWTQLSNWTELNWHIIACIHSSYTPDSFPAHPLSPLVTTRLSSLSVRDSDLFWASVCSYVNWK